VISIRLIEEVALIQRFLVADPNVCYLDGNSLGRLPLAAEQRIKRLVHEGWGSDLIGGWNADWIHLPRRLGDKIGQVIGAAPGQCVVADSTSVNLFKLATAALLARPDRETILTDGVNFPSDLYVLGSAAKAAGRGQVVRRVGREDQIDADPAAIVDAIDTSTALVSLSHVTFRSGSLYPMEQITRAAHDHGAMVLWDLSHSVGCVPIELDRCEVDLAVGCTYKYLCGGPGAPAFLYVRHDLQCELENPVSGWFGHRRPFAFDTHYEPSASIDRFLTGTPPVISLAGIEAGVDLVAEAGVAELRSRSIALTERLVDRFDSQLAECGFQLRSPRDPLCRGSHISLGHPEARRITENLIRRHRVIPDFRTPDNLRLGIAPLYTTEAEIDRAVDAIRETVLQSQYDQIELSDSPVT
jgi:kynureninase